MQIDSEGERLEMPESCTFDSWITTGQCRLTFDGLSDALFFDVQVCAVAAVNKSLCLQSIDG
jgi:hypothetical protein